MNTDEFSQFISQIPSALICYVVLFFVGLFALMIYFGIVKPARARRKLDTLNAAQAAADMQAVEDVYFNPPAAYSSASSQKTASGEYRVRLPDGHMTQVREVLTVARDLEDDRLLVYLDGTGYRSMTENPEVKEKFSRIMRELAETIAKPDTPRPVASTYTSEIDADDLPDILDDDLDLPDVDLLTSPTDDAISEPVSPPAPVQPPVPPAPVQPPAPKPASRPVPPAVDGTMPGALPDYRAAADDMPIKRQGFFGPKPDHEPLPELNLAAAIEAYLQHKLHFTQDYADRRLHIHSAPGGGVRIQVDDRYYDAVSDIEDAAIRQFIAETIQEWQERQ